MVLGFGSLGLMTSVLVCLFSVCAILFLVWLPFIFHSCILLKAFLLAIIHFVSHYTYMFNGGACYPKLSFIQYSNGSWFSFLGVPWWEDHRGRSSPWNCYTPLQSSPERRWNQHKQHCLDLCLDQRARTQVKKDYSLLVYHCVLHASFWWLKSLEIHIYICYQG